MFLSLSESESRRFALQVYRGGMVAANEADALLREGMDQSADVVILRMEQEAAGDLLEALAGKCYAIAADALIEFRKPLNKKTIADLLHSGTEIMEITRDNIELLDGLVERCYSEYRNHYHANPCLNRQAVLSGLDEFSRSFALAENRVVLVALHRGVACGYLCMEIRDGTGRSVIGGSALDIPQVLRHKVLCDLTHHGDQWLIDRGITQFKALTRIEKSYIQKLLIRNMHCLPSRALATIHINLFLSQIGKQRNDALPPGLAGLGQMPAPQWASRFESRRPAAGSHAAWLCVETGKWNFYFSAESDAGGLCAMSALAHGRPV